jgi:hypothetical protein
MVLRSRRNSPRGNSPLSKGLLSKGLVSKRLLSKRLLGKARRLSSLALPLAALSWAGVSEAKPRYEVWLVDQSDSSGKTYGGNAYVFQGKDLEGRDPGNAPAERIDLSAETSALCMASTGANPVRPHMIVMNRTETHAVLSFVASGHVVVFDAPTRTPIYCTRMVTGAGGARQAHAVYPSADDRYVLVANQNGKRFERIDTNYCSNTFNYDPAASIDLAGCTTPNGAPCQDAVLRPDNAPICPFQSTYGGPAFVSLRGGGMFAINPATTPMSIVGEWDAEHVYANGCGFQDAEGWVYYSAGGGTAQNLDQFTVYRTDLDARFKPSNPPNVPQAELLFNDPGPERDAHGVIATKKGKYVWMFDRHADVAEVFHSRSGERIGTVDLTTPLSPKLTPDLAAISPSGGLIFLSLRGPTPLSGDPHASTGTTPGLGIIKVTDGGKTGFTEAIRVITNPDAAGVERADAHGIRLRQY